MDDKLVEAYLHGKKAQESEPESDDEIKAETRIRKPAVSRKTMVNDQKIAA